MKSKRSRKPSSSKRGDVMGFRPPADLTAWVESEKERRGVTTSELLLASVGLVSGIDDEVLAILQTISEKLHLPVRLVVGAGLSYYCAAKMGTLRVVPKGVVRHPEFDSDGDGLITGTRRLEHLTEWHAKREAVLAYGAFSLLDEGERTEGQRAFMERVESDAALMKEIESAMSFDPQADAA